MHRFLIDDQLNSIIQEENFTAFSDKFNKFKNSIKNIISSIEKYSKGCPILVISNPVNSLATIAKEIAQSSLVICMTALDNYRGFNLYGNNIYIWGNHSNPFISN